MSAIRLARLARVLSFGALLIPAVAAAQLRPVAAGQTPHLRRNEGLLLIAVDSDVALESARLKHDGDYLDLGALAAGSHYALYVAEAGRYTWRDVVQAGTDVQPLDAANFSFDLGAGELNYAGDLIVRRDVAGPEAVVLSNRSLKAMDWTSRAFPRLKKKQVFRYAGNVPDGFPAYFGALALRDAAAAAPGLRMHPLSPSFDTLFAPNALALARMNPAGTQVAVKRRGAAGGWVIQLLDLPRGTASTLDADAADVAGMEWSSDDVLLTTRGEAGQAQQVSLARIDDGRVQERIALPVPGVVIDTLPGDDAHVLLATAHDHRWMVHKVDVSSKVAAQAFRPAWGARLNRGGGDEIAWYADGRGELAMAMRGDGIVFAAGGARELDPGFRPLGVSLDAGTLYGVTDEGRAQRELVAFDVAGKTSRTLFAKAGVDVQAPIFDAARRPIGVTYYAQGRLVSDYFAPQDRALDAKVRERFPSQSVAVLDRSADGRRLLLWVQGADEAQSLWRWPPRAC